MKIVKNISFILIAFLLLNCERNKEDEYANELNALNDIFIELIEQTYYYHTHLPPPLPPPTIENSDSAERIQYSTLWDKKFKEIMADSSLLFLAINDSLFSTTNYINTERVNVIYSEKPSSREYQQAINSLINGDKKNRSLDIEKLIKTGRFHLKYNSILENKDFWNKNPDISGYIAFSRIYFNEQKNNGVFYFVHTCGSLCGAGYLIKINKEKEQWKINSKTTLWVS